MPVPVKGQSYTFNLSLADAANPAKFKANPTIAAGDFQISADGSAFANLANLPTVAPAGSVLVKIILTAAEMDAAKVSVKAVDQAGAEWQDVVASIDVPTGSEETINDLQEGDHVETSLGLRINKKGTATPILDKAITGSLLSPNVTIQTKDQP